MQIIKVRSAGWTDMVEITSQVKDIVSQSDVKSGICVLYIPHTTAAVTITEFADPDVMKDILMEINKIIPLEDNYSHQEGNSAAHIKSSLLNSSQNFIIEEGKLVLGSYQGIYFCEFDGPRDRQIYVKIISG